MKGKIKKNRGFIQIPLLIGIIVSIITAIGIGYGAVEYQKTSEMVGQVQWLTEKKRYTEAIEKLEFAQNKWIVKDLGVKKQDITNEIEKNEKLLGDQLEYVQGVEKFNEGNWEKAKELLSKVSEDFPYYQNAKSKIVEAQEKITGEKLAGAIGGDTEETKTEVEELKPESQKAEEQEVPPTTSSVTLSPPSLISPINGEEVENLTPLLKWKKVIGAQIYEWAITDQDNKAGIIDEKVNAPVISVTVPSDKLKYNQTYSWWVKACDSNGCGEWEYTNFKTPQEPTPALPSVNNSDVPSFYSLTPKLDWSEMILTAYAYELVVPGVIHSTITNRKSTEIHSSLIKYDTTYSWKVRGCTDTTLSDCGDWSETQYFKTRSEPVGPKVVRFEWQYKGKSYSLTKTFYKSYYDHYNTQGRELYDSVSFGQISKEDYYFEFVNLPEGDDTISEIVNEIKSKAKEAKITSPDGVLEMALAFVQWLPYDHDKANYYYSWEQKYNPKYPRHPYETLYDKTAICTDASILGAAIARELGYGAALFPVIVLEGGEGHMTLGIKCPANLSSWNTGYCSTEMTGKYYKTGEVDNINDIVGITTPNIPKSLSEPAAFKPIEGEKTYQEICITNALVRKIKTLKSQIENKDYRINDLKKSLVIFLEQYRASKTLEDYYRYKAVYDDYDQLWEARNDDIASYNELVYEYMYGE